MSLKCADVIGKPASQGSGMRAKLMSARVTGGQRQRVFVELARHSCVPRSATEVPPSRISDPVEKKERDMRLRADKVTLGQNK